MGALCDAWFFPLYQIRDHYGKRLYRTTGTRRRFGKLSSTKFSLREGKADLLVPDDSAVREPALSRRNHLESTLPRTPWQQHSCIFSTVPGLTDADETVSRNPTMGHDPP